MRKWIIFCSAIALAVTARSIAVAASDTEWDRTVLPRPPQPFEGVTKRTLEGSVASFTQPVKAPADAPNILLVLIDDAGFGNPSTFGGPVATSTFDKLAAAWTSLQSVPRNSTLFADARGVVVRTESSFSWIRVDLLKSPAVGPGYNTTWPTSAASIAKILQAQRLQHRCDRQMAPYARHSTGTQPGLSIAGRTRSDSIISGDFSAAKPASSIPC